MIKFNSFMTPGIMITIILFALVLSLRGVRACRNRLIGCLHESTRFCLFIVSPLRAQVYMSPASSKQRIHTKCENPSIYHPLTRLFGVKKQGIEEDKKRMFEKKAVKESDPPSRDLFGFVSQLHPPSWRGARVTVLHPKTAYRVLTIFPVPHHWTLQLPYAPKQTGMAFALPRSSFIWRV